MLLKSFASHDVKIAGDIAQKYQYPLQGQYTDQFEEINQILLTETVVFLNAK